MMRFQPTSERNNGTTGNTVKFRRSRRTYTFQRHWLALNSALLVLALTCPAAPRSQDKRQLTFSTGDQLKADLDAAPCDNRERLTAAKELFQRMGASEADISIDHYQYVENLSLRKPGDGPDTIILGAHYDKVPRGCGAVDNWSGVVTVAHVYKTLRDSQLNKTLLFVLFGKEEEGLRGSKAMVNSLAEDQMSHVCAMVNVDSLGMGAPQVAENLANRKLLWRVKGLAKALNFPFGEAPVPGDSDSSSFLAKKIPALTIHALTNDFKTVLHTDDDRPAAAKAESLYVSYRLIVALVTSLDSTDCAVWRGSP